MKRVRIAGAGLAGSAAAISALQAGAAVRMWDPGRIPRHKVCGEFLTPEVGPILERLGLWDGFQEQRPARMARMRLIFDRETSESRFPEPAYGLSRFRLDALLRGAAESAGAQWIVERVPGQVDIIAHGRQSIADGRDRLFGFKSHFRGPANDAVELYFFDGFYVGVNPIEDGLTNVCGLGSEESLRRFQFDHDAVTESHPALAERLRPLTREMEWLSTGPLVYQTRLSDPPETELLAGDALQFVDPFTGTGMTIALWTGALAGEWVARERPIPDYYGTVRDGIARQYQLSSWLRAAIEQRWPMRVASLVPPAWLYSITRPKIESR